HEESPRGVHRNAERHHREHAGNEKRRVTEGLSLQHGLAAHHPLEPDAEEQQVRKRGEEIPEHEPHVRHALAVVAVEDGGAAVHCDSFIRLTKISSSGGPRTSNCRIGTSRESSASYARREASSPCTTISTERPSTRSSEGPSDCRRAMSGSVTSAKDRFTRNM